MQWHRFALAIAFLPAAAFGEWYEWRDANGKLHVTDQLVSPPPAPVVCRGACGPRREALPATVAPPADPPADPRADELRRREAQLASREAHLGLLRSAGTAADPARRELENLLEDEARADRAAIATLRAAIGRLP